MRVTQADNQIIITRANGSILWVTVGDKGADVSYAPDSNHYPEPMQRDDKGRERYPTEFQRYYA